MSPCGRLLVTRCIIGCNSVQPITRYASTCIKKNDNSDAPSDPSIRRSVFVSQSMDVFTNLAFEDWLYRNYDLTNHHILFLWRNNPCIVYGRHQNPWLECNVPAAVKKGITLARRNSGGGTVYHDNGNLNLTFLTSRNKYNRKQNLLIITRALFREWGLQSVINKREDIVVEGNYKVSGTAAKLGQPNAYHHCTLLVDVDKEDLSLALKKKENDIVTNATTSTRSPVKNLTEINPAIKIDKLITAISKEYLCTNANVLEDEGYNSFHEETEFQFINPTENCFPGLNELISEFRSWNWNFGKTPQFTVTETFKVSDRDNKVYYLNLQLEVENGVVKEVEMFHRGVKCFSSNGLASTNFNQDANVITSFCGTRYNHEIMGNIITAINCKTMLLKTIQTGDKSNIIVTP